MLSRMVGRHRVVRSLPRHSIARPCPIRLGGERGGRLLVAGVRQVRRANLRASVM
jgi:hypothetical protein